MCNMIMHLHIEPSPQQPPEDDLDRPVPSPRATSIVPLACSPIQSSLSLVLPFPIPRFLFDGPITRKVLDRRQCRTLPGSRHAALSSLGGRKPYHQNPPDLSCRRLAFTSPTSLSCVGSIKYGHAVTYRLPVSYRFVNRLPPSPLLLFSLFDVYQSLVRRRRGNEEGEGCVTLTSPWTSHAVLGSPTNCWSQSLRAFPTLRYACPNPPPDSPPCHRLWSLNRSIHTPGNSISLDATRVSDTGILSSTHIVQ